MGAHERFSTIVIPSGVCDPKQMTAHTESVACSLTKYALRQCQ
jgi:hypothetical protein